MEIKTFLDKILERTFLKAVGLYKELIFRIRLNI